MPRGRKRKPIPPQPPKGFYRANVLWLGLVEERIISPAEFALLHALAAFDWRGEGVDVAVRALGERIGVTRVHASNMLKRLMQLGLVTRDGDGRLHLNRGDGISVNSILRKMEFTQNPIGGGGSSLYDRDHRSTCSGSPPPDLSSNTPNLCKLEFTQNPIYVNSALHKSASSPDVPPSKALQGVFSLLGVATSQGMSALARLGVGPRGLLAWHKKRQSDSGSNIGSMIILARESPEMARQQAQRALAETWHSWWGKDFCPRCGAEFETYGYPASECPSCHVELRTCDECHELAVVGELCPYCGAAEPMEEDAAECADGQDAGDPVAEELAEPNEQLSARQTPCTVVQEVLRHRASKLPSTERHVLNATANAVDVLEFDDGYVLVVPSRTAQMLLKDDRELREKLAECKGISEILVEVVVQGSSLHRRFVDALTEEG